MATAKKRSSRRAGGGGRLSTHKTEREGTLAGEPTGKPSTHDVQPGPSTPTKAPSGVGLRVRMFRVGFGDFFLLSVPIRNGASHILIDCGVHARDLGSIRDAVTQMAQDCGHRLALLIMTHRHADHISGFATCSDIFSQITVERVWMPWFEDPGNDRAANFQASLTAVATRLGSRLQAAARLDPNKQDLLLMVENITGGFGGNDAVSSNRKALGVLHSGFMNKPEHDYYQAGATPELPQDLIEAGLTAQILGPPIDESLIVQMTNRNQQYLSSGSNDDDGELISPFPDAFRAQYGDYPAAAFEAYGADEIVRMIDSTRPDVLAAQAAAADKTLNNQSLVVLFSFAGKNLLFAGDAQWGNWENFLYGGAYGTPGHTELTESAKGILNKIDFYKVGHHGSANATPRDAVTAMRLGCVGMCSTQIHAYNEVPREPLLQALRSRMNGQLARSDQVAIGPKEKENPDAGPLPSLFKKPTGTLFIDYEF
jgi:beta-lactamase superfamily II metal-dependent hydrolase